MVTKNRLEVISHPQLIEAYVRIRTTKDNDFINVFAQSDEGLKEEKRREKRRLEDQLRRVKKAEDRVRQQTSYQSSQNNQKTHMAKLHHPMPDDEVEVVVNVPVQDPPQQPQNLDDWDMNED